MRPSLDMVFMNIAREFSTRATCTRASVGGVLTYNKHIISTGYNGAPRGEPHCFDEGCLLDKSGSCTRAVHCEENIILWAQKLEVNFNKFTGSTLYLSSYTPCSTCAKLLYDNGVREIVYNTTYHKEDAIRLCNELFVMRSFNEKMA